MHVCPTAPHSPSPRVPDCSNAWRNRALGPHAHGNAVRQVVDGLRTEVCVGSKNSQTTPGNNQRNPQYANYWAPLTRKRHIPPHPAQPQHTNDWAPRTQKRHQQEYRPQWPTERSDPTQHAEGRTGDCPGPRKETTTRRNVTQGVGLAPKDSLLPRGTVKQCCLSMGFQGRSRGSLAAVVDMDRLNTPGRPRAGPGHRTAGSQSWEARRMLNLAV